MNWPSLLSAANLLTLLRFPLAAAFLLLDGTRERVAILGVASLSDALDGWFARRGAGPTQFGAFLDPIADKIFMLAAFSAFVLAGKLALGEFFILLSRDLATAVGFVVAWLTPGVHASHFRARWPGKTVTILQLLVLFALLLLPEAVRVLIVLVAAASAAAIVDYTVAVARARSS